MNQFIHVRSAKFPILPGEKEELVNDGMYGKALAEYLLEKLRARGYCATFFCCEDWGWWVHLKDAPFTFGVRIYCGEQTGDLLQLSCVAGAPEPRMWSWRSFRFIDTLPWVEKLHQDLVWIFQADMDIKVVGTCFDSPFLKAGRSEPAVAPNGGPAEPFGNSGVAGGPPSVS
jgi:hypothetical protein